MLYYAPGFRITGIRTPLFLATGLLETTAGFAEAVPLLPALFFTAPVPESAPAFVLVAAGEGWFVTAGVTAAPAVLF
jgi:hypothetical protein